MANKKNSKYEKPGGMKKGRIGVGIFIGCQRCDRPHSMYRKFGLCRICLREMALGGQLPGVSKSSW